MSIFDFLLKVAPQTRVHAFVEVSLVGDRCQDEFLVSPKAGNKGSGIFDTIAGSPQAVIVWPVLKYFV
jgi:hypothetical protein